MPGSDGDRRDPAAERRQTRGRRLTDALATARRILTYVDGVDPAVRLLTISQVATMAGVSPRTVWRDVVAGKLTLLYPQPGRSRIAIDDARLYAGVKRPVTP
jgi:hypothetical protein